jgi:hypothetical protein
MGTSWREWNLDKLFEGEAGFEQWREGLQYWSRNSVKAEGTRS